ncbi:MAG: ABC transporter permease [Selenomonadales bacterium]|nr:ABC transporter permease [Selenomonadales bacterium]
MLGLMTGAWRYRHFIVSSIRSELRTRFVRSKLGGLWMILHPLAQVATFAFVLSAVLSARLPGITNRFTYAVYLTAGTLAWSLFSEIVTRSLTIFVDNGNLMKKVSFPRITLPLILAGSALVNNIMLLGASLVIFAPLGHLPSYHVFWVPLLMLVVALFGVGLGLVLGVLNVFMRDIAQVIPVVLQFGFWFTPIVYMPDILPQAYRNWMVFNPMYHLVRSYQNVMVFGEAPLYEGVAAVAAIALILMGMALFLFRKAAAEMVDAL